MNSTTWKKKWWLATVLVIMLALVLSACGNDEPNELNDANELNESNESNKQNEQNNANEPEEAYTGETAYSKETNPIASIEIEGGGVIKVELYPDLAPNTVHNFISLAQKGYYDGLTFHRVIENFMIQGGDPEGSGMGGPGYTIKGEFNLAGFQNDLSHKRGVISMARRGGSYDSAGSQFFIMHTDVPGLDSEYAAFGRVVEGIEVVDDIATTPTGRDDVPKTAVIMKQVTIETHGITYPEPEVINAQ